MKVYVVIKAEDFENHVIVGDYSSKIIAEKVRRMCEEDTTCLDSAFISEHKLDEERKQNERI